MGRYMQLSQDNLDHFGADAVKSYSAGHLAAMMVVIKTMGADAFARRAALEQAYAINAFADHFLTDLFSAGHIRTPRRALVEKMPNDPFSAGLCALVMHDEENAAGLNVANAAGDRWKAYGDGYLLDAGRYPGVVDDRANLAMVRAAVKASIAEVYDVWTTGVIPSSYASLALVPVSSPDPTDRSNPSPLFCMIDDVVAIRSAGGIGGPKAYVWDKDWSPLGKGIQAGLGIVTSAIEDWIKKVGRILVWDTPDFPPTNFEPPKPPAQAL